MKHNRQLRERVAMSRTAHSRTRSVFMRVSLGLAAGLVIYGCASTPDESSIARVVPPADSVPDTPLPEEPIRPETALDTPAAPEAQPAAPQEPLAEPSPAPASADAEAPSRTVPPDDDARVELAILSGEREQLFARIDALEKRNAELERLATAENAARIDGSARTRSAGSRSALSEELVRRSLLEAQTDPATGGTLLTDLRAGAATGSGVYPAILLAVDGSVTTRTYVQYAQPLAEAPFIPESISIGDQIPVDFSRWNKEVLRSGVFRVQRWWTDSTVTSEAIDELVHSETAVMITFRGSTMAGGEETRSALVSIDQQNAFINIAYAIDELQRKTAKP